MNITDSSSQILDGKTIEAEAAHGTVTRHYRFHQQGKFLNSGIKHPNLILKINCSFQAKKHLQTL